MVKISHRPQQVLPFFRRYSDKTPPVPTQHFRYPDQLRVGPGLHMVQHQPPPDTLDLREMLGVLDAVEMVPLRKAAVYREGASFSRLRGPPIFRHSDGAFPGTAGPGAH